MRILQAYIATEFDDEHDKIRHPEEIMIFVIEALKKTCSARTSCLIINFLILGLL